jgi:hypothetical protein
MSALPVGPRFLLFAAAVVGVGAAAALATILSDPYTSADADIYYTIPAAFLAGSVLFTGFALVERGSVQLGWATVAVAVFGFVVLTYSIWEYDLSGYDSFWIGIITLVTAQVASWAFLVARGRPATLLAAGAALVTCAAGFVSLVGAFDHDPFWRVGTPITTLWILALLAAFLVPVVDRMRGANVFWPVVGVALSAVALTGLYALNNGEFAPDGYSITFTAIAAWLGGSAFVAALVLAERGRSLVSWLALCAAPLGLAMIVDAIWEDSVDRFRWLATGIALVAALLVSVAARLVARVPMAVLVAGGAGAAAGVAAAVAIADAWSDRPTLELTRTSTAFWIIAVAGFLLVPVVDRLASQLVRREAV